MEAIGMMWDWHGSSWWWWFLMSGGMLLFWAAVAWVVVQIARSASRPKPGSSDPEATLAERFAAGEIDADEYKARLRVLRDGHRPAA